MKKYFVIVLSICMLSILAAGGVFAQEVIRKVGDSCPTNYASAGDSCMPLTGAKYVVTKIGSRCPSGFSVTGDYYCYRPHKATTKVIPKIGNQCPNGYWADGSYCQSFK